MPELPEVETIRISLEPKLTGRMITGVSIALPKMIENPAPAELETAVQGRKIIGVERRGKYLLIRLDGESTLAIHLRMTGQLMVEDLERPPGKATYFKVQLDNGTELRFSDQRKFGKVFYFESREIPAALTRLGPEPLSEEFTPERLKQSFAKHQLAVKKALLDQTVIAGIGNIYADEALFLAGIHPARPVDSLTDQELEALYHAIRQVLTESISHRGTTKRDYRDGEGHPGSHQDYLRVYGRKGEPCIVCGTPLAKMIFGGRGTHFCPMCQG